MPIQTIPSTAVRRLLRAARLPLDLTGAVVHRGLPRDDWPPVLAFEAFEANVKQVVGSFTRDDRLVQEGRIEQAKVAQLRKASTLEAVAEERRARADTEFADRRARDEERARTVEKQADARRRTARKRAADEKQAAARDIAEREQAVSRLETAAEESLDRQEREVRAATVEKEREALSFERRALAAEHRKLELDRELAASRAARRAEDQPAGSP